MPRKNKKTRQRIYAPSPKSKDATTVISKPDGKRQQKDVDGNESIRSCSTEKNQSCQPQHRTSNHQTGTQNQGIGGTFSLSPFLTALATLALVSVGVGQCNLVSQQSKAIRQADQFNRQSLAAIQRAYLFVQPEVVSNFEIGSKPTVDVTFSNSGKTPAYNVIVRTGVGFGPYPTEPTNDTFENLIQYGERMFPDNPDAKTLIMPGVPFASWARTPVPLASDDVLA